MTRDEAVKVVADVLRSVDERGTYESDAACILDAIGFDQMQERDELVEQQAVVLQVLNNDLKVTEKENEELRRTVMAALAQLDRVDEARGKRSAVGEEDE